MKTLTVKAHELNPKTNVTMECRQQGEDWEGLFEREPVDLIEALKTILELLTDADWTNYEFRIVAEDENGCYCVVVTDEDGRWLLDRQRDSYVSADPQRMLDWIAGEHKQRMMAADIEADAVDGYPVTDSYLDNEEH